MNKNQALNNSKNESSILAIIKMNWILVSLIPYVMSRETSNIKIFSLWINRGFNIKVIVILLLQFFLLNTFKIIPIRVGGGLNFDTIITLHFKGWNFIVFLNARIFIKNRLNLLLLTINMSIDFKTISKTLLSWSNNSTFYW